MPVTTESGYQVPTVNVATALPKRAAGSSVLIVPVVSTGDDEAVNAQRQRSLRPSRS